MNPDNHFNKIPHTEGAYKTAPNVSIFDMQCVDHNIRMEEIDKRLDLLKEYIGYRADWLAKYNGHHSKHFYFLKEHRILPITQEGEYSWSILTFDQWLSEWHEVGEDERFVYYQNRNGESFTSMKLPKELW